MREARLSGSLEPAMSFARCCAAVFVVLCGTVGSGLAAETAADSKYLGRTYTAEEQARSAAALPDAAKTAEPAPFPILSEDEFDELFPEADAADEKDARAPSGRVRGDVRKFPVKFAGKLFAQDSGGVKSCTAQFVSPTVILTAAHCVTNEAGQAIDVLGFLQQYENGAFNGVDYGVACFNYFSGWAQSGAARYPFDFAMIKTTRKSATGYFGWKKNWIKQYKSWKSIGYPGAIDQGEIIQVVSGKKGRFKGKVVEFIHGVDKFTQGSSGGAWVAEYSANLKNNDYVIGLNSFGFENKKGRTYGPYFDDKFADLLAHVEGGCQS